MSPFLQSWIQVGTICVVLVPALFYQTHYIDKRFEDLNHRFDDLKDWIRCEIKRLEDRLDRLEHPVAKP